MQPKSIILFFYGYILFFRRQILPLCKEINTYNLKIENEIHELLNLIKENNFEKFYIVCPRNKNFTHFIEIKHFLCDLNKTMLKLVPYKISNQIIRRK